MSSVPASSRPAPRLLDQVQEGRVRLARVPVGCRKIRAFAQPGEGV
jgi:hypothetical protein